MLLVLTQEAGPAAQGRTAIDHGAIEALHQPVHRPTEPAPLSPTFEPAGPHQRAGASQPLCRLRAHPPPCAEPRGCDLLRPGGAGFGPRGLPFSAGV
jgi:hypothetical protein